MTDVVYVAHKILRRTCMKRVYKRVSEYYFFRRLFIFEQIGYISYITRHGHKILRYSDNDHKYGYIKNVYNAGRQYYLDKELIDEELL